MKKYLKNFIVFDTLLIVFAYGTVFNQLNRQPIADWDEGIYATNAIEMAFNGNYLVKYFASQPEMLAVEPPLVAWLQTLSIKLFGFNEVALRLPSAIAALLVAFLLVSFCYKELNNRIIGYLSAFVLLTSPGYVGNHIVRTCDLDSVLVLCSTFYVFSFYKYLKYEKPKHFYYALLGVLFAFYAKSFAGIIMLLPLFIFTIYKKKILYIFCQKEIFIGIITFMFFVLGYYILREHATPGYIKNVWNFEFAGRFLKPIDGHEGPFLYYFNILKDSRFLPWFGFLPIGLLITFFRKTSFKNNIAIFLSITILSFWLIISFASTKLLWYDAQLYPYLSITVGCCLYIFYKTGIGFFRRKIIVNYIYFILFTIGVFYYPFYSLMSKNISEGIYRDYKYGFLMKKVKELHPQYNSYKIISVGFQPSAIYYSQLYNLAYHFNIRTTYNIRATIISESMLINEGDTIMFTHPYVIERMSNNFYYTQIERYDEAALVKIDSLKKKL
jgi:4-amino-4-deoxy-L-arabinose transferase-like glycosyltransferase